MPLFFVRWICCVFHLFILVSAEDTPEILNNHAHIDVKENDIAHFTCVARGLPRPLIRWEKAGKVLKDEDEGIAILLSGNRTIQESHLFVAVSGEDRRGQYTCVSRNNHGVAKQTFGIKEGPFRLSNVDLAAVTISLGLTSFLVVTILLLLWRRNIIMHQSRIYSRKRRMSESWVEEYIPLQPVYRSPNEDKVDGHHVKCCFVSTV